MKNIHLTFSPLSKTWILDFDGTLVLHNGYKTGQDQFLPGAKEFLKSIPHDDFILILTAREEQAREKTVTFLKIHEIRYNKILFNMPQGERILFNDSKPSGLPMSHSIECTRNEGLTNFSFEIDQNL